MKPRLLLLLSICVISIASSSSVAAQSSIVKQGATVRFRTTPDDSSRSGRLATLTADSLVLATCGNCERLLYGRSEIRSLEVMRPTAAGDRIISGLLLGGAVGGGLGWLSARTCHGGGRWDKEGPALPI